ncbi:Acyl-CoA synthetase (AMP-forming)/AMP-acid ligase II [Nonomuraea solani]|uniref:Acyl-CoA synthetase (AMP-forming)/AMP-acid ligase II n=1 Tax=Nonomuraea solani TaxID=1144553 RepID=A0A1H6F167_9ACTN|nr:class I adenylate-forming enzyme family protein [Nonomuraea solani]SEH02926.1 Acyl-CoA synthetase (AMP-forming)/AMP-acid ligase II [Nonomuraea solani]
MEDLGRVETYLSERTLDIDPGPGARTPVATAADLFAGLTDRRGNVVLLALPSGTTLLRHLFGALHGGAVPVAVSPAMPAGRLEQVARRLGARLLVTPHGRPAPGTAVRRLGDTVVATLPGPWQRHDPDHVIIMTSGTSGIFSGCLHRASSLFRNAARHAESVGLGSHDTMLVTLPLNFSYALVAQALAGLVTDARLVIAGPPFSRRGYLDAIVRHGVTSSSLTPFLLRHLLSERPPAGLRMLTVGGDGLPGEEVSRLVAGRPGLEVYITYGLTEAGPRVSTLAAHREPAHRHGSVGLPLRGVGVALRDVRDGVGELLVTSDTVMVRRVGTVDGPVDGPVDSPMDGAVDGRHAGTRRIATGDLFRLDPDGYLHFAGRLGDSCVVEGVKVSLPSVRRLATALPGVVRAATRPCSGGAADEEHVPHDGQRFVLELHMREVTREAVRPVRAELHRLLLRAERPCRILAVPAADTPYK